MHSVCRLYVIYVYDIRYIIQCCTPKKEYKYLYLSYWEYAGCNETCFMFHDDAIIHVYTCWTNSISYLNDS